MSDSESWRQGLAGQAPGANTNLDSYNAGKAVHDANLTELNRQNAPPAASASGADWAAPASGSGANYYAGSYSGSAFRWNKGHTRLAIALLLSFFAGPLGLFYASRLGAVILLAGIIASVVAFGPIALPGAWQLGTFGALIWAFFAIRAHNRRVGDW